MQNMRIIFLLLLSTINMSMSMDHQSYSINDLPAATKSRIIALIFCMNRLTNQELPTLCIQEIVDQIDNLFEPLSLKDQDMLLNTLDPITNTIQSPYLSAREPDSKEIAKQKKELHEKNRFLCRVDISDELQKLPDTDKMSPKKLKQLKRTIREKIFQDSDKIDAPLRTPLCYSLDRTNTGFNNINLKYIRNNQLPGRLWRLYKDGKAIPTKEFESSKEIFISQEINKKYIIGKINSSGNTTLSQPINKNLYAFDKQSCSFIPTGHKIDKHSIYDFLIKHNIFSYPYTYNNNSPQYAIHILNAQKYLHNKSIAELQELKQQIDKYNNNQH